MREKIMNNEINKKNIKYMDVAKGIGIILVVIYKLPKYNIAIFPTIEIKSGVWWIIYSIVGICIPIIIINLLNNIILKIRRCLGNRGDINAS